MKINNYHKMQDEDLVEQIQKGHYTEECLNVLIDRHSGLCINLINGYVSKHHNDSLRQELIQEKDFQIYNSALKYKSDKGSKFSTYLGNEIKWKCLNIYNSAKRKPSIPVEENVIDYLSYHAKDKNSSEEDNEIFSTVISQSRKHPDERVGRIFQLRYVEGQNNNVMPWKKVSSHLGMSIQGCINIHDAALEFFKYKINKEI
jgi:DNA-directed RNA polymerase specialized sigma24 family protein